MYKCVLRIAVLAALFFSFSCKTSTAGTDGINHVVLCWLKDKSPESRSKFKEAVNSLADIPEVVSVVCGDIEKSSEPVADNSFDIGFIITFKNKSDLEAYLPHPLHVKAVNDVLKPSLKKVVVYDFKSN